MDRYSDTPPIAIPCLASGATSCDHLACKLALECYARSCLLCKRLWLQTAYPQEHARKRPPLLAATLVATTGGLAIGSHPLTLTVTPIGDCPYRKHGRNRPSL
ncbi:hypothetical protein B296_00039837 [Ensete ventricosum]|uniref:Uncharacterized protein n=1 Tax=Ensete ventricosum TaxID=4639 RepID=A0A426YQV4_ENSVE|nr:hypothetical protein B296_00039837 [Ensete ventricosum]